MIDWINVKTRLPEKSGTYFVWYGDWMLDPDNSVGALPYSVVHKKWNCYDDWDPDEYTVEEVTFWGEINTPCEKERVQKVAYPELTALANLFEDKGIPFTYIDVSDEMFIGREIYYPSMYKWIYVAMMSPVSDGGDDGLIEIRENGTDSKSRKVAGKLTTQEAFKIIEAHWNKKTNNFWETE